MGPIWGRQDPGGPHVGPMNLAIWAPVSGWLYELWVFVAVVFIIYVDIGVLSRYLGYGLVIISHRTMWDVTSCNYLYMTWIPASGTKIIICILLNTAICLDGTFVDNFVITGGTSGGRLYDKITPLSLAGRKPRSQLEYRFSNIRTRIFRILVL